MGWEKISTDYFTFTRQDRIAILVLVVLIVLVIFAPAVVSRSSAKSSPSPDAAWMAAVKDWS